MKYFTSIFLLVLLSVCISCSPKGAAGTATTNNTSTENTSSSTSADPNRYGSGNANGSRTLSNGMEIKMRSTPSNQTDVQKTNK